MWSANLCYFQFPRKHWRTVSEKVKISENTSRNVDSSDRLVVIGQSCCCDVTYTAGFDGDSRDSRGWCFCCARCRSGRCSGWCSGYNTDTHDAVHEKSVTNEIKESFNRRHRGWGKESLIDVTGDGRKNRSIDVTGDEGNLATYESKISFAVSNPF